MNYFGGLNRGTVEEIDRDAQSTKSAMELLNYQKLNPLDTLNGSGYPSRGNIRATGGYNLSPAMMAGFDFAKRFDDGGILKTQGGNFSNGISYINEGGTHEENPLEGVPMGYDNQGTPNVVEQGETIYDDYVYSHRLHPSKEFLTKYKIASGPHPTFADVSKKFGKESAERPNDPISQAGLKAQMATLREEQERVKAEIEARKQKAQNDFLQAMGVNPEEAAMEAQMMGQGMGQGMEQDPAIQQQYAQQQALQEQAMQEEALWQQLAPEQAIQGGGEMPVDEYGNPMYAAYGGSLNKFGLGGRVNKFDEGGLTKAQQEAIKKMWAELLEEGTESYKKSQNSDKIPFGTGSAKEIQKLPDFQNFHKWLYNALNDTNNPNYAFAKQLLWDMTAKNYAENARSKIFSNAENAENAENAGLTSDWATYMYGEYFTGFDDNFTWDAENNRGASLDLKPGFFHTYIKGFDADGNWKDPDAEKKDEYYNPTDAGAAATTAQQEEPNKIGKYKPNWWQTVPALGNLGMVTADVLGLNNKPTYTEANAILGSIAGPRYISANPRETYYNPKLLDSNWLINLQNAQRASDMSYAADVGGMRNPGAALAGRISANNKYQKSVGELSQSMIEANNKNRLEQANVGLKNNELVMNDLYRAAAANQGAWDSYAKRRLEGTTAAMAQRYKERSDTDAAKGQNLSNLFKSAGNIGDTLFNADRALALYKAGVFGPMKEDIEQSLLPSWYTKTNK